MADDKRARLKQWLESGEARLHPLAFPQRELWEASTAPPQDPSNHIFCLIKVRGLIAPQDCDVALRRVMERQEVLRLTFLPGKAGPLQMVRRGSEPNLDFRDLTPAEGSPEGVEEIAREIYRTPFDLVQGPLYRATALRRAADDHVLVFVIHHAIADGWSLGAFVQDLFGAYLHGMMGETGPLPAVPLSFTAWDAAERAFWQPAELAARTEFWKATLAGAPRLWSAPSSALPMCRWVSRIPPELASAVRELARQTGATLFSTLLAAFQVTLARWTGQDDFVAGTPVANRGKQAVRETMGYFSGNVPLRSQLDRSRSFSDSLRATHQATVDAFANAMPFAELTRALGEAPAPGRHPIYQVRFALQNHPVTDVALPTLSAKLRMRSTGTARFDLGCEITERHDQMEVAWLYQVAKFPQEEMETLDRWYQAVLTAACREPERRISDVMKSLP